MCWPPSSGHSRAWGRSWRVASPCQDRSDFQASFPLEDQGLKSRAKVHLCKIHCDASVVFQAYGIVRPSYLCLIFIFSCCSEQAVAEINPYSSNRIRIRNLSGFQVSSLCFNCDLFVCMVYSHHTTQSYIYTLKQLM